MCKGRYIKLKIRYCPLLLITYLERFVIKYVCVAGMQVKKTLIYCLKAHSKRGKCPFKDEYCGFLN